MYASKSTYVIFAVMVIFSGAILWIYYTMPVTTYIPPFEKNKALHAVGESNLVKLYYVALEDDGKNGKAIGCGDSIVAVEREIPATTTPLAAALNLLLSNKKEVEATAEDAALSNTLSKSNLKLAGVDLNEGTVSVKLTGKLSLAGVCDSPRIEAQLEETILQFPGVKTAEIFINNKPIEEVMSAK
jgi:hypothetical protein